MHNYATWECSLLVGINSLPVGTRQTHDRTKRKTPLEKTNGTHPSYLSSSYPVVQSLLFSRRKTHYSTMVAVEAEIWSTPPKCRPTWTLCCRLLLVCNSVVLFGLAALALYAYPRIDTLETQLAIEKGQLLRLQNEIRTEQQVQIQDLHEQVQEEHDLTFYTLAGIFTLLTCLISMFHMSTHLRHMKEPIIQRKIVAILWMSPIYSLTSFLSLLYPATEGYCAIIKDFYESYCIYTFLSFLIAVLGRGNRDQAIKVLAKRADHLDIPSKSK